MTQSPNFRDLSVELTPKSRNAEKKCWTQTKSHVGFCREMVLRSHRCPLTHAPRRHDMAAGTDSQRRRLRIKSAMTARGKHKPTKNGSAYPSPGWARGPRPTWRRGARQVRLAVDVGLEFLVLLFQDKRTKEKQAFRPVWAGRWFWP